MKAPSLYADADLRLASIREFDRQVDGFSASIERLEAIRRLKIG